MNDTSLTPVNLPGAGRPEISNAKSPQEIEARRTAEDFEAVLLSQLVNVMSAGIKTDGPFGGGPQEGIYRSMLNEEYARAMSRQGGIGIADTVYREILALQEVKP